MGEEAVFEGRNITHNLGLNRTVSRSLSSTFRLFAIRLIHCDGLRNRHNVYADNTRYYNENWIMGKYQKSFTDRREELRQALYRIEGAINRYRQNGEVAELGIIAIELRGLLFSEALFVSLSKEKDFPLELLR